MNYRCPVCMYPRLPYPPRDYHICPCCGTEFGNDDANFTVGQLREMWIAGGANWFFGKPPAGWNAWLQLIDAGLRVVPWQVQLHVLADAIMEPTDIQFPGPHIPAHYERLIMSNTQQNQC
jgi:hypothetical protein